MGYRKCPLIFLILYTYIEHGYIYLYIFSKIITKILMGFKISCEVGEWECDFQDYHMLTWLNFTPPRVVLLRLEPSCSIFLNFDIFVVIPTIFFGIFVEYSIFQNFHIFVVVLFFGIFHIPKIRIKCVGKNWNIP